VSEPNNATNAAAKNTQHTPQQPKQGKSLRERLGALSVESVMSEHMHDICLVDPPSSAGNPVLVASVHPEEGVLTNKQAERFARALVACWNQSTD
jgi:hypothetical protein